MGSTNFSNLFDCYCMASIVQLLWHTEGQENDEKNTHTRFVFFFTEWTNTQESRIITSIETKARTICHVFNQDTVSGEAIHTNLVVFGVVTDGNCEKSNLRNEVQCILQTQTEKKIDVIATNYGRFAYSCFPFSPLFRYIWLHSYVDSACHKNQFKYLS